jgi:putative phage-type endonuclease
MKIHDLTQGSPEWHAYRAQHFNASDAPAMMGVSPYKTRSQFVRETATGAAEEHDAHTLKRFDDGHRYEALARPLAEAIIGQDLYPVVGSEGKFSASFDGLTMAEDIVFEHKSLNDTLRAVMVEGNTGADLPPVYRVQMEQQLMISDAGRALFVASKWDGDQLVESRHCWYEPDLALREQIVAGWAQFEQDVAAYAPAVAEPPAPVGKAPETLPALRIEITGAVTASNLDAFKRTALAAIRSVNRDLTTDQHFADADRAVKWCVEVESRLAACKDHVLSQAESVYAALKALDDIDSESSRVRIDLTNLITKRKADLKDKIIVTARDAFYDHLAALNEEIAPIQMLPPPPDFAGAAKNKRTLVTLQDAVDTALANAKIAADAMAREWRAKLDWFGEEAAEHKFLFHDLQQLVQKPADDFKLAVAARIEAHKKAEADRAEQAAQAARLAAAAIQTAAAPPAATDQNERFVPGTRTLAVPATVPPPIAAPTAQPFYDTPPPWSDADPLRQLLDHIATAFAGKFPSQPKVSQEFWADLRTLAAAVEATISRSAA